MTGPTPQTSMWYCGKIVLKPQLIMCVCVFHSNVTPQSHLDLKLWSCHTLRKELLGSATIDLLDTLRTHDGKSKDTHTQTIILIRYNIKLDINKWNNNKKWGWIYGTWIEKFCVLCPKPGREVNEWVRWVCKRKKTEWIPVVLPKQPQSWIINKSMNIWPSVRAGSGLCPCFLRASEDHVCPRRALGALCKFRKFITSTLDQSNSQGYSTFCESFP